MHATCTAPTCSTFQAITRFAKGRQARPLSTLVNHTTVNNQIRPNGLLHPLMGESGMMVSFLQAIASIDTRRIHAPALAPITYQHLAVIEGLTRRCVNSTQRAEYPSG